MTNEPESADLIPPGCGLFVAWLLASIVGMALGWAVGWQFSFWVPGLLSTAVLGLVAGGVLGAIQWLVLRPQFSSAGWWVLATALGWGAGLGLGAAVAQAMGYTEAEFGLVVGLVIGAAVGILQWIILRRHAPDAYWWIPASIFAWGISLIYYQPAVTITGILYGMLSGIVTGIVLLWLLHRPVPDIA